METPEPTKGDYRTSGCMFSKAKETTANNIVQHYRVPNTGTLQAYPVFFLPLGQ